MKWAKAIWTAFTYVIALLVLLGLFSKFSQPFEVAVISLIGLVFITMKEQFLLLSSALSDELFEVSREFLSVKQLVASTVPDRTKQEIGYDPQLFTDRERDIRERQRKIHLSPQRLVVVIGLWLMLIVCLCNLIWALDH